jgi:mannose-6-phosphate isomerase-like protein (cupin superfamily)
MENASGRFDIYEIARSFPDSADTMLLDRYLTDQPGASARVFRVYKSTPAHYHLGSNEYLYVVSGRGIFWIESIATQAEFGPGHFLFFGRGVIHAMPEILEGPVVFLALDIPRRAPRDVIFVDPEEGTPETFIEQRD